jgi:hypothetical protein
MRKTDRYGNDQVYGQWQSTLGHHGDHPHLRHARGAS